MLNIQSQESTASFIVMIIVFNLLHLLILHHIALIFFLSIHLTFLRMCWCQTMSGCNPPPRPPTPVAFGPSDAAAAQIKKDEHVLFVFFPFSLPLSPPSPSLSQVFCVLSCHPTSTRKKNKSTYNREL